METTNDPSEVRGPKCEIGSSAIRHSEFAIRDFLLHDLVGNGALDVADGNAIAEDQGGEPDDFRRAVERGAGVRRTGRLENR